MHADITHQACSLNNTAACAVRYLCYTMGRSMEHMCVYDVPLAKRNERVLLLSTMLLSLTQVTP